MIYNYETTIEDRIDYNYNQFINIIKTLTETNFFYKDDKDYFINEELKLRLLEFYIYHEEIENNIQARFIHENNKNYLLLNTKFVTFDNSTIIHELAHFLYFNLALLNNHTPTGEHNLEFAIINYYLYYQLNGCMMYFNFYDIKDEKNIEKLTLNVSSFNRFIQKLEIDNLNDLYLKSVQYADKLRSKLKANKPR